MNLEINDFLRTSIVPIMTKISNQRHIKAIRKGLIDIIPITFIGSLALILNSLPVNLAIIDNNLLLNILEITLGMFGVFVVLSVSYNLSLEYKLNQLFVAAIALINYLLVLIPFKDATLHLKYLINGNLFTAIIVATLTVEIIRFINNIEVNIQFPEAIPKTTINFLFSLIPNCIAIIFFYIITFVLQHSFGILLPTLVIKFFSPISNLIDSPLGVFFFGMLAQLLWFTGTHGVITVGAILRPFLEQHWLLNANSYLAGEQMAYIFTMPFWNFYMLIGGSGATLVLSFLCRKSKVKQLREIGEISLWPGLFNIDESIIFASPLVANKIMFIPFVFIQPFIGVIAYFATKWGWVGKAFIRVPWVMPAPIGALISTLDWNAFILVMLLAFLSGIIYYPFFRKYESYLLEEQDKEKC